MDLINDYEVSYFYFLVNFVTKLKRCPLYFVACAN